MNCRVPRFRHAAQDSEHGQYLARQYGRYLEGEYGRYLAGEYGPMGGTAREHGQYL